MLSLPWTRPTAPCRGPARAEASREQQGRPGTGRDGTDGELRGSDVYRRTRAAGAAEGMGDISDQEAERLPRGWGCRVPTVRNEPSTDVGQTRPWSLARGRVLPKPPPHAPRTTPEAPRPPYGFPTAAVMSHLNPVARNHTFILRFGKQNGLRKQLSRGYNQRRPWGLFPRPSPAPRGTRVPWLRPLPPPPRPGQRAAPFPRHRLGHPSSPQGPCDCAGPRPAPSRVQLVSNLNPTAASVPLR